MTDQVSMPDGVGQQLATGAPFAVPGPPPQQSFVSNLPLGPSGGYSYPPDFVDPFAGGIAQLWAEDDEPDARKNPAPVVDARVQVMGEEKKAEEAQA